MPIITDPDLLAQGVEVTITEGSKTITLNIAGDLTTDGITLKCLYSWLKEEWKTDADLIRFPFPMVPITDEQFEFVQGWDFADNASRNLVRTAGWAVRNTSGVATQMFAGVISLGSLRNVDSGAGALTINVVAASRTFTRTTGSYVTDGFKVGQNVTFSGFTNGGNNVEKIIEAVNATVITVTTATGLVNETGNNDERAIASAQVYYVRGENETQLVDLGDIAAADTFKLTWGGRETGLITYAADMTTAIKDALEALSSLEVGDISVVKRTGQTYDVTFKGTQAATALENADSGAGALTINVVAASKTFTRTTGSYLTDGFLPGMIVTFSGFTNGGNNTTKIIQSVTATVITVTSATGLVDETGSTDERAIVTAVSVTTVTGFTPNAVTITRAGTNQRTATPTNVVLKGVVNQAIQIYKDTDGDGLTTDAGDYDYRDFLKLYVREWGDTFAVQSNADIGVTSLTYQAYRFPLTTSADPKISELLQSDAGLAPYNDVNVIWYRGTGFETATVRDYVVDEVGKDTTGNRWFRCTVAGTLDAAGAANYGSNGGTGTFIAFEGERNIPGVGTGYFPFTVAIDGDIGNNADPNASAEVIYESVAWQLTQVTDMDVGAGTRNGEVAAKLLTFVGDTLVTSAGVWIDDYATTDINRLTFVDATGATRNFLFTASLTINFGANLIADPDAEYFVFFTNDDAPGANLGYDYGTANAIIVDDASSVDMVGNVSAQSSVTHTFAYDSNVQRGAGSAASNAPITVVGLGLTTGQFVSTTGTIERSTTNAVSLVAALERNYQNP